MKLKVKVKVLTEGCEPLILEKGDWIDLRAAESVTLRCPTAGTYKEHLGSKYRKVSFEYVTIPLGIAIQMPKGYEANIVLRSGTFKTFHVLLTNAMGVIDNSYQGNNDELKAQVVALDNCTIEKFDRFCQMRISLSQKATFWQKIKNLFYSGVEFVVVNDLSSENRGGYNSSGVK